MCMFLRQVMHGFALKTIFHKKKNIYLFVTFGFTLYHISHKSMI